MGWGHQKAGYNNQDAYYAGLDFFCVADGVSKVGAGLTSYSELGARLAVNIAADVDTYYSDLDLQLFQQSYLRRWGEILDGLGCENDSAFINQHALSTLLCGKLVKDKVFIFGIGDGFYNVNDHLTELPSNNKPQSLSYNLMGYHLNLQLYAEVNIHPGLHIGLASDGLRFWQGTQYYPVGGELVPTYMASLYQWDDLDSILRRMNKQSKSGRPQLLEDDTTVIWITF